MPANLNRRFIPTQILYMNSFYTICEHEEWTDKKASYDYDTDESIELSQSDDDEYIELLPRLNLPMNDSIDIELDNLRDDILEQIPNSPIWLSDD